MSSSFGRHLRVCERDIVSNKIHGNRRTAAAKDRWKDPESQLENLCNKPARLSFVRLTRLADASVPWIKSAIKFQATFSKSHLSIH